MTQSQKRIFPSWGFGRCYCLVACCCQNRLKMKGRVDIFYQAIDVAERRIDTFFRPHFLLLVGNGLVLSFGWRVSLQACLVLLPAILFHLTLFLHTKLVFVLCQALCMYLVTFLNDRESKILNINVVLELYGFFPSLEFILI